MLGLKVGVVVLHYRFWPGVAECLRALEGQTRPAERVVVVDNCSGDGSAASIGSAFPWVEVLEAPTNGGYSSGMNLGMAELAAAEDCPTAVLLLTHDCHLDPDALSYLVGRLEASPGTGAVGPLLSLHDDPESVYMAGGDIDDRTWDTAHAHPGPTDAGLARANGWVGRGPHRVRWLDGACILLRTAAAGQAGALDERYFLYYEDVDLGLALGAAGWGVECVPQARAWHQHAKPGALVGYLASRNHLLLIYKHAPARFRVRQVARELARIARDLSSREVGRASHARHTAWALLDFGLGHLGPPRRTFT